jgi:hypothetical protein
MPFLEIITRERCAYGTLFVENQQSGTPFEAHWLRLVVPTSLKVAAISYSRPLATLLRQIIIIRTNCLHPFLQCPTALDSRTWVLHHTQDATAEPVV